MCGAARGRALSAVLPSREAEAGPAAPCAQPPGPPRPAPRHRGWVPAATGTEPLQDAAPVLRTAVPPAPGLAPERGGEGGMVLCVPGLWNG